MMRIARTTRVLLLIASMLALLPVTYSGAQEAAPAATPATKPQPPLQPTHGPGSSEVLFGGVTVIEQKPPGQLQADYWLFVPTDPLPGTPRAGEVLPLVIFVHGYTATIPDLYLAWIEHLVRRGAVVLYTEYQGPTYRESAWRQTLQDDVRDSLETLEHEGVPVDLTRVAVVGHSLGGVLAVDYAASAAAAGLPLPAAVMSVAPGCNSEKVACLGADLGAIPATTRLLLVTEADDPDPVGTAAVERIWAGLEGVPRDNRDVVTLVTDAHARPALAATHVQALANQVPYPPDAYDWYGTWKWLDALMSCAFEGEWCEVALGNTPEQRYMGEWSDGVPVTEAVVTDDPAAQALPEIDVAAQVLEVVRDAGRQGSATPTP
jgi:predicted alpha/beta hydrolase family esterase